MMNNVLRRDLLPILGFLAVLGFLFLDPLGLFGGQALGEESAGTTPSPGSPSQGNGFPEIANILGMIFILAVLIEVGLAVLFQWRLFLRYLEGRGAKVPIAFLVSYGVVMLHGIDVPADVVAAFGFQAGTGSVIGQTITALIIAGGSASVHAVFQSLGWRNPTQQAEEAKEEREKSKGTLWIDVKRAAGGTAEGKPVTLIIDNELIAKLPPDVTLAGGQDGFLLAPGKHTTIAEWTTDSGEEKEQKVSVRIAAGKRISVALTLS